MSLVLMNYKRQNLHMQGAGDIVESLGLGLGLGRRGVVGAVVVRFETMKMISAEGLEFSRLF